MLGRGSWLFWWGRLERGSSRQDSTLGQVRLARDFRALAARSWCLASDASHTVRNVGSMPQALAHPRLARGMRRRASLTRLPDGRISSPALHQSSRRYEQCNAEDGRQMSMPPAALPGVAAAGRPRCSRVHLYEVRILALCLPRLSFVFPEAFRCLPYALLRFAALDSSGRKARCIGSFILPLRSNHQSLNNNALCA